MKKKYIFVVIKKSMTDYVRLGMVLPEEGGNDVSWTPVDRKMYSQDMRLSETTFCAK